MPSQLLAAAVSLALILTCFVGAYAHAAGHAPPATHGGLAGSVDAKHRMVAPGGSSWEPRQVGHAHDCDGTDHSPLDCCDSICNGGQAILAASLSVPHPVLYAPLIQPAATFDGAEPGRPDRPPKPSRSA